MQITKSARYSDFQETFTFDSEQGLVIAQAVLKKAGIEFVVPEVEGSEEPVYLLQVKGKQVSKQALRLFEKRYSFGMTSRMVTPDFITGELIFSDVYPCTLVRMNVPVRVKQEILANK